MFKIMLFEQIRRDFPGGDFLVGAGVDKTPLMGACSLRLPSGQARSVSTREMRRVRSTDQ